MALPADAIAWGATAVLTAGLAALSWIDLKTGYLPDWLQVVLAIVGLTLAFAGSPVGISWRLALIGAAINGGAFWSVGWAVSRLKKREAMGFGDVKLVAVGGLWLGPWALPLIMVVGGLATLLGVGAVSAIVRRPLWRGEMPFGPGLAAGILGCFVGALLHASWIQLHGPFEG